MAYGRWGRTPCRGGGGSRFGPPQVRTCEVGSRPVPGGGSRLSLEKAWTQRVAGGYPPSPPFFRARSLPLARFGGRVALFRSMGYYGAHLRTLIWEPSFPKMLSSIFFLENASQIGFRISGEIVPLSYQGQRSPKRANGSERAMNPGVQGRSPGPLSPHFSGEMGTPAGQAGQRGAAPRGSVRAPPTQRVPSGTASPQRPSCYRGPASRQGAGRANPWSMGPAPCPRSSMAPRAPER